MGFDINRFYMEYGVENKTSGHPHCRSGWVNTACPFCTGNEGYHLGFNTGGDYFVCWRCGWHSLTEVVKEHARCSWGEAKAIERKYVSFLDMTPAIRKKYFSHRKEIQLPAGTDQLKARHMKYLKHVRGFRHIKELTTEWDIRATGPIGMYQHRILVPIYHRGEIVSYQGRDITGRAKAKYLTCAEKDEVTFHKHILYGFDEAVKKYHACIIVEGIFDAWKLGHGAVATFGIKFLEEQIGLVARHFRKAFILYDVMHDPSEDYEMGQEYKQAEKIAYKLDALGIDAEIIMLTDGVKDAGDLDVDDGHQVRNELLNPYRKY